MAGTLPHYSAVPGQGVPGRFAIGTAGNGYPLFLYEGHQVLTYLDYLNGQSGGALVAVPGGRYAVLSAGHQNSYAVPPPDGRWNQPAIRDFAVLRPRVTLAQARAAMGPGAGPREVTVRVPKTQLLDMGA